MRTLQLIFTALLISFITGCACCAAKQCAAPINFDSVSVQTIEKALRENPLDPKDNMKITMLWVGKNASEHLVQIRGKERQHRHNHHTGNVKIWKGKGTLLLNNNTILLKEGDIIEIPQGAPHSFTNDSATPAVAIVVFTPAFDGKDTEYLESR